MGQEDLVNIGRAVGKRVPATAGSTYRRIWELGWPVSISTSTITLLTLVNLFWIGQLGTGAVAGV